MPRRNYCEHPAKHANSAHVPKGLLAVSLQLSMFLVSRYNTTDSRIRWLCSRCHAFESKEMMIHQEVNLSDSESWIGDEVMMIESPDNGGENDDNDANEEFSHLEEEKEHNSLMDSGFIPESKANDDGSTGMDEDAGDVSYEIEYQKNKAMEQLSAVFELFQIEPIHDK